MIGPVQYRPTSSTERPKCHLECSAGAASHVQRQ
jgi:hypothetical protein